MRKNYYISIRKRTYFATFLKLIALIFFFAYFRWRNPAMLIISVICAVLVVALRGPIENISTDNESKTDFFKQKFSSKHLETIYLDEPNFTDYVVIDFETTGLSAEHDKIIEIAAVKYVNGILKDSMTTLINPRISIPPKATSINGITNSMVRNQPTIASIHGQFVSFIDGFTLVAHNAPFDIGFLKNNFRLKSDTVKVFDTLSFARNHFNFPNNKLVTISNALGIDHKSAHRGQSDVEATAKVFQYFSRESQGNTLGCQSTYSKYFIPKANPNSSPELRIIKIDQPIYEEYVAIHFETTGFSPTRDKIIEISAQKYKDDTLVSEYITLINPEVRIPSYIDVTNESVSNMPKIHEVHDEFIEFISDYNLLIYKLDIEFLKANFRIKKTSAPECSHDLQSIFVYKPFTQLHKIDVSWYSENLQTDLSSKKPVEVISIAYEDEKKWALENDSLKFAKAFEKIGNYNRAIEVYEMIIERKFESRQPFNKLVSIYRKRNDVQNELRVLKKSVSVFNSLEDSQAEDVEKMKIRFENRIKKLEKSQNKNDE